MNVCETVAGVRRCRWAEPGVSWGLVPTMGYLHEGHLSLVRRAREENDRVAVSIFVNPAQFGDDADLAQYPRDLDRDLAMLAAERVDLVWTPLPSEVYPAGFQTYVDVEEVTRGLEGGGRPGHFRGVSTVVSKLFNVFEPQRAYFGQKDAQQLVTVRRMVEDLNFNLEIVGCRTVREPDGLAMSSRNARLDGEQRGRAAALYRALCTAEERFARGERDAHLLRDAMSTVLEAVEGVEMEYVSIADPVTLEELDVVGAQALASLAASLGPVRLIDNVLLDAEAADAPANEARGDAASGR